MLTIKFCSKPRPNSKHIEKLLSLENTYGKRLLAQTHLKLDQWEKLHLSWNLHSYLIRVYIVCKLEITLENF